MIKYLFFRTSFKTFQESRPSSSQLRTVWFTISSWNFQRPDIQQTNGTTRKVIVDNVYVGDGNRDFLNTRYVLRVNIYRAGPDMVAIILWQGPSMLVMKETVVTLYDCNHRKKGLDMLTIMIKMGTWYACNLDHIGDWLCLQSQMRSGLYMLAICLNRDQICLQCRKSF